MFINLRGPSGAGKSYIARAILDNTDQFTPAVPVYVPGRKQPLYYTKTRRSDGRGLSILGHYNTACGGGDTIHVMDDLFNLARERRAAGDVVLFEGLISSVEASRIVALHNDYPGEVHCALVLPPLKVCLESVQARRDERAAKTGKAAEPLNPANTIGKHKTTQQYATRLRLAGLNIVTLDREEALRWAVTTVCLAGNDTVQP